MYSTEEKNYLALGAKFRAELDDIDEKIGEMLVRKEVLAAILDGNAYIVEEKPEKKIVDQNDRHIMSAQDDRNIRNLVAYLKKNPGLKRSQIIELWLPPIFDAKDLSRMLEKGKRRGVLTVEGKSRAAQWYAAK